MVVAGLAVLGTTADPARGSCAEAVVVDGHVLIGEALTFFGSHPEVARARLAALPRRVGTRVAVAPACNDTNGSTNRDQYTMVSTLAGLPATVAVVDIQLHDIYIAPAR